MKKENFVRIAEKSWYTIFLCKEFLILPYITQHHHLESPIKAFLFLIHAYGIPQGEAQRWIDRKRVSMDGIVMDDKAGILQGDVEVLSFVPEIKTPLQPIFETADFAVFDKPNGMLTHPRNRQSSDTIVDIIKTLYGPMSSTAHRIDRETSGLLMVCKTKQAESRIKRLFEERHITKSYLAWVHGRIDSPQIIDAPILKNPGFGRFKVKVLIHPSGKKSLTEIHPMHYDSGSHQTLIRATPLTGRQHQIRVHLEYMEHPIIGDPLYGTDPDLAELYLEGKLTEDVRIKELGSERLMLHAHSLEFQLDHHYKIISPYPFVQDQPVIR